MARRLDVPRLGVDDRKVGDGAPRRTRKSARDNISIKRRAKARQGRNVPINDSFYNGSFRRRRLEALGGTVTGTCLLKSRKDVKWNTRNVQ